jgi:serine/threonine protein phosphatase 1
MNGKIVVVGDAHGNYEEACRLLEACGVGGGDRVVFVGDLVDRGPRSDAVLDLAMALERQQGSPACVRGNHEDRHLAYDDIERVGGTPEVSSPTHARTRAQLRPEHYAYMRSMPLWVRLPEHNAVVVHAGVYPGRSIEAQDPRHLMHVVMIAPMDQDGRPSGEERSVWPGQPVPSGTESLRWGLWTRFWDGPERVVFGHLYTDVPLVADRVVGLDGGCCFGGELRALVLPDDKIVTVKAGGPGAGSAVRRSTGRPVARIEVYPGVYAFS